MVNLQSELAVHTYSIKKIQLQWIHNAGANKKIPISYEQWLVTWCMFLKSLNFEAITDKLVLAGQVL